MGHHATIQSGTLFLFMLFTPSHLDLCITSTVLPSNADHQAYKNDPYSALLQPTNLLAIAEATMISKTAIIAVAGALPFAAAHGQHAFDANDAHAQDGASYAERHVSGERPALACDVEYQRARYTGLTR